MYIRMDRGPAGLWELGQARSRKSNLVLLSGGPGLFDNRDIEHDLSWGNYVTPPLLLTDTRAKHARFVGQSDEVWWLIYRPAYEARWVDDVAQKRPSVDKVRQNGFSSYVAQLEARARARGWHLRWFRSADRLWTLLASFRDPIDSVWYWGHARNDLWLTLARSSAARAARPAEDAVVTVASIARQANLGPRLLARRRHRFVGCNTMAFAQEWARVFRVPTEGVQGVVNFRAIHATGGEPRLVSPARWWRFTRSGAAQRAAVPVPQRQLTPTR